MHRHDAPTADSHTSAPASERASEQHRGGGERQPGRRKDDARRLETGGWSAKQRPLWPEVEMGISSFFRGGSMGPRTAKNASGFLTKLAPDI